MNLLQRIADGAADSDATGPIRVVIRRGEPRRWPRRWRARLRARGWTAARVRGATYRAVVDELSGDGPGSLQRHWTALGMDL